MLAIRTLVTIFFIITVTLSVPVYAVDLSKMVTSNTLSTANVNQNAVIRGEIENIKEPFSETEPLLFHVGNSSDGKKVLIGYTQNKYQAFHADKGIPKKGTQIIAQGKVWDYDGMLLIVPNSLSDIMIEGYDHTLSDDPASNSAPTSSSSNVSDQIAPEKNKNQIKLTMKDFDSFRTHLGKQVTFSGKVTEFTPSWSERAPNIMIFKENEKILEVVYWDQENPLDQSMKEKDITIEASGQLQDYRGRLQVKVQDLKTIKLIPAQNNLAAQ